MGRALNRRATRAAHFNGVVQLALSVDRFRGALELPETWEIRGLMCPQEHLSQSASADRFKHPRHPFEPVVAIHSGHCMPLSTATTDVFSIRPYISYPLIVTPHAQATRIRRGNASMKNALWWAGQETQWCSSASERR